MKKIVALFAALMAFASALAVGEAACDWSAAEVIADGVRMVGISRTEPRLMKGRAVRVDLADRSLTFTATGRDRDWGKHMPDYTNSIIRTRRVTVDEFMAQAHAPVAEGGRGLDMILAFNSAPWMWLADRNPYADLSGLNISDGVTVTDDKGTQSPMFVVWKSGAAEIVRSFPRDRIADAWLAHSGFAIVLEKGRPMYKADGGVHPRTVVGLSADRRWLYVLVVEGRHKDVSLGADYWDLAQLMLWLGAYDALNLDGGGSSALVRWDGETKRPQVLFQQETPPRPCALNIGICRR